MGKFKYKKFYATCFSQIAMQLWGHVHIWFKFVLKIILTYYKKYSSRKMLKEAN